MGNIGNWSIRRTARRSNVERIIGEGQGIDDIRPAQASR